MLSSCHRLIVSESCLRVAPWNSREERGSLAPRDSVCPASSLSAVTLSGQAN
uniref:Uncharacterized protein n=1 Tax=Knipowitschia caucasica TaxID=637954 RepID=A0AAV2JIK8_KNICA